MAARYSLRADVVLRPEAAAGVVFRPCTGGIEPLNETGFFILSCVESGMAEEEIASAILRGFDLAGPDRALSDVLEFLEAMEDAGVVARR